MELQATGDDPGLCSPVGRTCAQPWGPVACVPTRGSLHVGHVHIPGLVPVSPGLSNLNSVLLVVFLPLFLLSPLPGTWNFSPVFYSRLFFWNNFRESRCRRSGEALSAVWAHGEQGFDFHSSWPQFFFYFVLGALFFINPFSNFFLIYTNSMCVWVLGGLWKLIYESTTFLFSCHLRLSGLSALGLSFTGGE